MRATRAVMAVAGWLALAGCGNPRNEAAADACRGAIAEKLGDKTYSLDRGDMVKRAHDESPELVAISSTAVFDKGLSTEYSQTFDCRVRLENNKPASVIGLQFNWNKDDLKKVNTDTGG